MCFKRWNVVSLLYYSADVSSNWIGYIVAIASRFLSYWNSRAIVKESGCNKVSKVCVCLLCQLKDIESSTKISRFYCDSFLFMQPWNEIASFFPCLVVGRTNETDKEWVIFIILAIASLVFIKKFIAVHWIDFCALTFFILHSRASFYVVAHSLWFAVCSTTDVTRKMMRLSAKKSLTNCARKKLSELAIELNWNSA